MRAKQVTPLSKELFRERGADVVPKPPVHWFVRGPRGGIYMATGSITREVSGADLFNEEWFWRSPMDRLFVIDKSEGAKYVRPGTRRHREAVEAGT